MFAERKNKENRKVPAPGTAGAPPLPAGPAPSPCRANARYIPGFRFRPADLLVLILILGLAGMIYYGITVSASAGISGTTRLEAVLTVSGEEVWRADISAGAASQSYQATGTDGHLTVRTEAGRACISYSDCPDQICVRTGWISAAGQSAVCLPNRCVLTIEAVSGNSGTAAAASSAYDIVSR